MCDFPVSGEPDNLGYPKVNPYLSSVIETSSANFLSALKARARELGGSLTEYELVSSGRIVLVESESDVFDALGVKWRGVDERKGSKLEYVDRKRFIETASFAMALDPETKGILGPAPSLAYACELERKIRTILKSYVVPLKDSTLTVRLGYPQVVPVENPPYLVEDGTGAYAPIFMRRLVIRPILRVDSKRVSLSEGFPGRDFTYQRFFKDELWREIQRKMTLPSRGAASRWEFGVDFGGSPEELYFDTMPYPVIG